MKKKTISIVIPNYNGRQLLAENLPRVIEVFSGLEVIVVDDGSTDNSPAFIKKNFPQIKVASQTKNKGFSTAVNRGFRLAENKLVFLLNNDAYPKKDVLDHLLPYFVDQKTFAVNCLERTGDQERGRGIGGFKRGLFFHQPGRLDKNNTLWAFGAGALYNKEIFHLLSGLDEDFNPFYWEDFDISYRALKSGYRIYFEKKAVIFHQQSPTIKKYYSGFKIKAVSFRNQLLTCWKNLTDKDLLISHLFWLPYHLLITTLKTKGAFLIGFLAGLGKLFKVLKRRRENKFLYSDKEVLEPFQKEVCF